MQAEWRLKPNADGTYDVQKYWYGHWSTKAIATDEEDGRRKIANLKRKNIYV